MSLKMINFADNLLSSKDFKKPDNNFTLGH